MKFGFSTILSNGSKKSQCVLCDAVLGAESMEPSNLKRHLETKHSEHNGKDFNFFKRHEVGLRKQKLDFTFQQENRAILQAGIALEIEFKKKLENLIQLKKP